MDAVLMDDRDATSRNQNDNAVMEDAIKQLETKCSLFEARIKSQTRKLEESKAKVENLENELESVSIELKQSIDKRTDLQIQLSQLQKKFKKVDGEKDAQILSFQERLMNMEKEEKKTRNELLRYKELAQKSERRCEELFLELGSAVNVPPDPRLPAALSQIADLMQQVSELQNVIASLETRLEEEAPAPATEVIRSKSLLGEVDDLRQRAELEKDKAEQEKKQAIESHRNLLKENEEMQEKIDRLQSELKLARKRLAMEAQDTARNLAERVSMKDTFQLLAKGSSGPTVQAESMDTENPCLYSLQSRIQSLLAENERLRKDKETLMMMSLNETAKSSSAELKQMAISQELWELRTRVNPSNPPKSPIRDDGENEQEESTSKLQEPSKWVQNDISQPPNGGDTVVFTEITNGHTNRQRKPTVRVSKKATKPSSNEPDCKTQ
ncbi:hypothetical protein HDU96_000274 [Phlyctochytrium bullatum]|nr:hypothetical protein HDU96_000274 [Phlyctochytrium bullatum]